MQQSKGQGSVVTDVTFGKKWRHSRLQVWCRRTFGVFEPMAMSPSALHDRGRQLLFYVVDSPDVGQRTQAVAVSYAL